MTNAETLPDALEQALEDVRPVCSFSTNMQRCNKLAKWVVYYTCPSCGNVFCYGCDAHTDYAKSGNVKCNDCMRNTHFIRMVSL